MCVVIRLQRKGFRNNPIWHIVVARRKTNLRGNVLEKVGAWSHKNVRKFEREIVLNKERIQYWLAVGARPSPRVMKFLSFVDMMPAPPIKYGLKTLYEKPNEDEKTYELAKHLNPYRLSHRYEIFLHKILEQEQNSHFTRKEMMKNEAYKNLFLGASKSKMIEFSDDQELLQKEISQLKEDLKNSQLDPSAEKHKRDFLAHRINKLFAAWKSNQEKEDYQNFILSQKDNKYKGYELTQDQLKHKLEIQAMVERDQVMKDKMEQHLFMAQPISQEEFKEYLMRNGNLTDVKAEVVARQTFRKARDNQRVVTRADAQELCAEDAKFKLTNIYQFCNPKSIHMESVYIPVTKPILPFPEVNKYSPEDYYEIPRLYDPIKDQDRPYSLPNIAEEHIPNRRLNMEIGDKDVRGRRTVVKYTRRLGVKKWIYDFSSVNREFKYAWAPLQQTTQFIVDMELFKSKIL